MTLPAEWISLLSRKTQEKRNDIERQLLLKEQAGEVIYPPAASRYTAFKKSPDAIRAVIVGQDPYHKKGQAMGLSFSVPHGVAIPASLRNIYKELDDDCGVAPSKNGDLSAWADQGVLLLNTSLSVQEKKPGSHAKLGWDEITAEIIKQLSIRNKQAVFILWGAHAQTLKPFIRKDSLVIESSHPSPMGGACYKGFFGSKPFSRANQYLESIDSQPIDWRLR